jgi:hypothetical protein
MDIGGMATMTGGSAKRVRYHGDTREIGDLLRIWSDRSHASSRVKPSP